MKRHNNSLKVVKSDCLFKLFVWNATIVRCISINLLFDRHIGFLNFSKLAKDIDMAQLEEI